MAQKPEEKPNKLLTAAAVLGACVLVASIAFVSLQAAALVAGSLIIIAIVRSDISRRRFWELAFTFRIRSLSDKHDALAQKVTVTRHEIQSLRQNVEKITRRLNENKPPEMQSAAENAAAVADVLLEDDAPVQPHRNRAPAAPDPRVLQAVRAGQKPAAAQQAANDEEYNDLSDMIVRELVVHAVEAKNIDVFVQPIMRLPQRRVRFYELYARVRARPGMYLPARRYMKLAQANNLSNDIDNQLLMHCLRTIQASAHIERAAPLFINITASTLKNTRFMKDLLSFVTANRNLAPRLIFELPHAQFKALDAVSREIMRGIGKLGCSISIDHVDSIDFDVPELQKHYVRFIKIAAQTLIPHNKNEKTRAEFMKQKRRLDSNGISLVVEKVETENDLVEILDFDIAYGEGLLFGRPDLEAAYRKRRAA